MSDMEISYETDVEFSQLVLEKKDSYSIKLQETNLNIEGHSSGVIL